MYVPWQADAVRLALLAKYGGGGPRATGGARSGGMKFGLTGSELAMASGPSLGDPILQGLETMQICFYALWRMGGF